MRRLGVTARSNDQAPRPRLWERGAWVGLSRRAESTSTVFNKKAPRKNRGACSQHRYRSADALPGLAAAEHAAEGAALHTERVRSLHRDRRVIVAAGVGIGDLAGPFGFMRLHVDQNLLARFHGVAAEVLAALFDADIALVLFG